jgi:ATP-dependent Lhr-like helicase
MDVDGLVEVVKGFESGSIRTHFVDSPEPSVLSYEILNGKPYTFLDDAPLEERRTRAVQLRRGLPLQAGDMGKLDPGAIARVRDEAAPVVRDAEELHDLLLATVLYRPRPEWAEWFGTLSAAGRAITAIAQPAEVDADPGDTDDSPTEMWCALERRAAAEAILPGAYFVPDVSMPGPVSGQAVSGQAPPEQEPAVADSLRGHLDLLGPVTVHDLARIAAIPAGLVQIGLARLEAEGFAMRGSFDPDIDGGEQWCARRLLARVHSYTQARLRREIEPVTTQDYMRFLLQWQHVAPGTQRQGRAGVLAVIDQLQGFELPAGSWEESVLTARVENYQTRWLEDLCMSGELVWGRLTVRPADTESPRRGASTPSRATPITFALREDLPWLLEAARGDAVPAEPAHGPSRDVLDSLRARGALFHSEIGTLAGRLPVEIEEGLWDLVTRGIVTADGFQAVRSLLSAREAWRRRHRDEVRNRVGRGRVPLRRAGGEGRWSLLPEARHSQDPDTLAESVAGQLLARWGVVFWDLLGHEELSVPWRQLLWALRRLEARGLVRGGRFVNGFVGEQFALPEAVDHLRRLRRSPRSGEVIQLNAADPLNLTGIVLPGRRVPAVRTNRVVYYDGLLEPAEESVGS